MAIGGQAVIEGVMMRNLDRYAVAVRLKNGKIKIHQENNTAAPKLFQLFFIRGIIGLFYTLYDGIKALLWSSNQQLEKEEKLSKKEIIVTLLISFAFAVLIFVAVPFFSAHLISSEGFWFNFLDGLFRIVLFIGYLLIIVRMDDVKILFQYHGAEHKTIACYENKEKLTVKNVKKHSRFHPRCGTSFIFIILILSIILFMFISGPWYVKLAGRILLLPVLAGIGYEIVKLSSRYCKNPLVKILVAPGLWIQRITTKEPTAKQIAVAIKSLQAVAK